MCCALPRPNPSDPVQLRYANNSNYKNDTMIRKEVYVTPEVLAELKRIIEDSEVRQPCGNPAWACRCVCACVCVSHRSPPRLAFHLTARRGRALLPGRGLDLSRAGVQGHPCESGDVTRLALRRS